MVASLGGRTMMEDFRCVWGQWSDPGLLLHLSEGPPGFLGFRVPCVLLTCPSTVGTLPLVAASPSRVTAPQSETLLSFSSTEAPPSSAVRLLGQIPGESIQTSPQFYSSLTSDLMMLFFDSGHRNNDIFYIGFHNHQLYLDKWVGSFGFSFSFTLTQLFSWTLLPAFIAGKTAF